MAASIRKARTLKRRFDAGVRLAAWYAGWCGFALLAGCALLWLLPDDLWDGTLGLKHKQWPLYTMIALLTASLVGWCYINNGQDRIKDRAGKLIGALMFLVLPLACMALDLLRDHLPFEAAAPVWFFVRWYPPALIILCAAVFLLWKAKPRKHVYLERGLGFAVLFLPYALLFTYMALGVHVDWIDGPMHETLAQAGAYALVIQLVCAHFIGSD